MSLWEPSDDEFCDYHECFERPSVACRCGRDVCARHFSGEQDKCFVCCEQAYESGTPTQLTDSKHPR